MSPLKGRSRQSACKAINFYNRFSKAIGLRFKKLPATKVDKELKLKRGWTENTFSNHVTQRRVTRRDEESGPKMRCILWKVSMPGALHEAHPTQLACADYGFICICRKTNPPASLGR